MSARIIFRLAACAICLSAISLSAQELIRRPKLIVTDNSGTVTTLQPTMGANDGTDTGSATKGKDVFADAGCGGSSVNQGSNLACSVTSSTCNPCTGYGYLQFSLANMPTTNIASARIEVYTGVLHWGTCGWPWPEDPIFGVRKVTSDWNEMTLVWNSQPTFDSSQITSYTFTGVAGLSDVTEYKWVTLDITDLYKGWANGSVPNYGVRISHENAFCMNCDASYFFSSDDGLTNITYNGATGGDPATVSAVLNDVGMGKGAVGRTLTFTVGAASCTGTTDSTGLASCTLAVGSGNPNIAISFAGDTRLFPTSLTTHLTNSGNTHLQYVGPYTLQNGQQVLLSAFLLNFSNPVAGQSVDFTLGTGTTAQTCNAVTDSTGLAACSIAAVSQPGGLTSVTAAFAGSGGYSADTITVPMTISGSPGINLSKGGDISIAPAATAGNTSVISVTPSSGFTGTVNLSCAITSAPAGATSPASCAIPASVSITGTTAATVTLTVATTSNTTMGAYTVAVTGIDAATGKLTASTVVNVAVKGFTLSRSGDIVMSKGSTTRNTALITLTPGGGFTGTVSLTCTVTPLMIPAPSSPPTCSIPSSVSISGTTAATATLTINTTASAGSTHEKPLQKFFLPGGGGILAVVFLFGLKERRRKCLGKLGMLALLVMLAGGGLVACNSAITSSNSNSGTTTGGYTVTVTGTSSTMTATSTLPLVVM